MEVSPSLPISSNSIDPEDLEKGEAGLVSSYPSSPMVAQEAMVCPTPEHGNRSSMATATNPSIVISRSNLSSESSCVTIDGVAIERRRNLEESGLSEAVVDTLLQSRKTSTSSKYYRIWNIYEEWCKQREINPSVYSAVHAVEGLEKGLATNELKSQISALSVLWNKPLAADQIIRFITYHINHTSYNRYLGCNR